MESRIERGADAEAADGATADAWLGLMWMVGGLRSWEAWQRQRARLLGAGHNAFDEAPSEVEGTKMSARTQG